MTIYHWKREQDNTITGELWVSQETQELVILLDSAFKHTMEQNVILSIWERRISSESIIKPSEDKYPGSILTLSDYLAGSELGYNVLGESAPWGKYPGYVIYEIFHAWDTVTAEFDGWLDFYRQGGYRNDGHYPYN